MFVKTIRSARLVHQTIALTLLLAASSATQAGQFLVFSTAAIHFKNADERNTFTPGIGWEYSPTHKVGFHVGTLSDSFGYQSYYGGLNWASNAYRAGPMSFRFLLGASIVHKQFRQNREPETKLLPFPVLEIGFTPKAVLNISGAPKIEQGGLDNNAVVFFQYKLSFN